MADFLRIASAAHGCPHGKAVDQQFAHNPGGHVAGPAGYQHGFAAIHRIVCVAVALSGGGWRGGKAELLSAEIEGGPVEAARLAGQLLTRAFAFPQS